MDTEKHPCEALAETICNQFGSIHERNKPLVQAIADSTPHERAMLVAAVEIGYGVELIDHIALKSLGASPALCRAQTLDFDTSLCAQALAYDQDACMQAASLLHGLAGDALRSSDEHLALYRQLHDNAAGSAGAKAPSGESLGDPHETWTALLPLLEAKHAKLSARRKDFKAAVPTPLKTLALLECADLLLERCNEALEVVRGRNPFRLPEATKMEELYAEAVRDADLGAVFILLPLEKMTSEEFAEILNEVLDLSNHGTRCAFAFKAAQFCELVSRAVTLAEQSS